MPSTREIRQRIRSVANTAKVTSAMQLIAASKMRRAQQMVSDGRAYAEKMEEVLQHLVARSGGADDAPPVPLLASRPVGRTLLLLVTPDRGLAGGLVANINRAAGRAMQEEGVPVDVVAVGRKGERFVVRAGQELKATFSVGDRPSLDDTLAISRMLIDEFISTEYDKVLLAYSLFVNTTVQQPVVKTLLPVEPAEESETGGDSDGYHETDYIFEPDAIRVLDALTPRYVETQVYHAILEAIASEHSARMVAMRNATDNANELIDDLTLDLNKARQESITSELLDMIGGAAAVGG